MDYSTDFISSNYFFITGFLFFFGACVGSFLNVCIYRMPIEGMSIVVPGSHCPSCSTPIRWFDNIPLLSYIILQGKCRQCKTHISARYVFVEVLTAFIFVKYFELFGFSPQYFFYVYLMCSLIVATLVDFKHQIIPDEVNFAGMLVALLGCFFFPQMHGVSTRLLGFLHALLGLLVGGGSIYITGLLGNLAFHRESMGGGDVKFMAMIGAFLGWKLVLVTYFIAPFFGSIIGLYAKYVKKEDLIPYGPFLSFAAVVALFWGHEVIRFVFGTG